MKMSALMNEKLHQTWNKRKLNSMKNKLKAVVNIVYSCFLIMFCIVSYCVLCLYLICYLNTIVLTKDTRNKDIQRNRIKECASPCCSMPNEEYVSYIMSGTSYNEMMVYAVYQTNTLC